MLFLQAYVGPDPAYSLLASSLQLLLDAQSVESKSCCIARKLDLDVVESAVADADIPKKLESVLVEVPIYLEVNHLEIFEPQKRLEHVLVLGRETLAIELVPVADLENLVAENQPADVLTVRSGHVGGELVQLLQGVDFEPILIVEYLGDPIDVCGTEAGLPFDRPGRLCVEECLVVKLDGGTLWRRRSKEVLKNDSELYGLEDRQYLGPDCGKYAVCPAVENRIAIWLRAGIFELVLFPGGFLSVGTAVTDLVGKPRSRIVARGYDVPATIEFGPQYLCQSLRVRCDAVRHVDGPHLRVEQALVGWVAPGRHLVVIVIVVPLAVLIVTVGIILPLVLILVVLVLAIAEGRVIVIALISTLTVTLALALVLVFVIPAVVTVVIVVVAVLAASVAFGPRRHDG